MDPTTRPFRSRVKDKKQQPMNAYGGKPCFWYIIKYLHCTDATRIIMMAICTRPENGRVAVMRFSCSCYDHTFPGLRFVSGSVKIKVNWAKPETR